MSTFVWILAILLLKSGGSDVIQIDQGFINGTVLKSRSGIPFHAFYGIPYAAPPVGSLRFEVCTSIMNITNNQHRSPKAIGFINIRNGPFYSRVNYTVCATCPKTLIFEVFYLKL